MELALAWQPATLSVRHRWATCSAADGSYSDPRLSIRRARMAAAYHDGGAYAVIISGVAAEDERAWSLAMTAYYGPAGVRECWLDVHGCPSRACRERFPAVDRAMREADRQLADYLGACPRKDG